MITVYSDAGHGGRDPGASGRGIREKDQTILFDKYFTETLEKSGKIKVERTRTGDTYMSLEDRAKKANRTNAKILVSHHMNAYNTKASGIEICYTSQEGKKLGQSVLNELVTSNVFENNRGLKHRPGLYMLRKTKMPAIIIEYGFIDHDKEREKVLKNIKLLATLAALGVLKYFSIKVNDVKPKPEKPSETPKPASKYPILGKPTTNVAQMKAWAKKKKADPVFIELAQTYYDISVKAGVDPAVTYTQSAKETGYCKFGGVIDITYKNPCGMKTNKGGHNLDPNAHMRFETWEDGISAQVDHLALYAGAEGYPKRVTTDPRHFAFILGTAKTVEELGAKWATSDKYGLDIIKMMEDLKATPYKEEVEKNPGKEHWAEKHFKALEERGIVFDKRDFDKPVTRGEMFAALDKALK